MSGFDKLVTSYEEALAGLEDNMTDLACLDIEGGKFILRERAPDARV